MRDVGGEADCIYIHRGPTVYVLTEVLKGLKLIFPFLRP